MSYTDPGMQAFAKEFFYSIIHDYPLATKALKVANRAWGTAWPIPRCSLPIKTAITRCAFHRAMEQLHLELKSIRPWNRLGNLNQFIARAGADISEPLRFQLQALDHSRSRIMSAVARVSDFDTPALNEKLKASFLSSKWQAMLKSLAKQVPALLPQPPPIAS